MKFRIYGPVVGNISFARVAQGMSRALESMGMLAGFVPIDTYEMEETYLGYDADVGVFVGPPNLFASVISAGNHKHNLALISPNSTWLPKRIIDAMSKRLTGFITPSDWAAGVLRRYTELPVYVWQHGIDSKYFSVPPQSMITNLNTTYESGQFNVLHMASTAMERKGTHTLIEAWSNAICRKKGGIPLGSKLVLVTDSGNYFGKMILNSFDPSSIIETNRQNIDIEFLSSFYHKFHLVIQPSRGEAFGMVPLEAVASGVPVACTSCSGHGEYFSDLGAAGYLITSGEMDPIDDGPEAMAPEVTVSSIHGALFWSHFDWKFSATKARDIATLIQEKWDWKQTTKRFLENYVH